MKERLYHIIAINERTKRTVYLTRYPMPHKQCCTMMSKQTPHRDVRVQLIEVN